jgi:N-acyl-D-aspartate/D-glutamate deacylase
MAHDLILRGGRIVDGTGGEPYDADLAVDAGRISRIGDLGAETAATEIDATGRIVTPGFIDLHTHLDAQVGWDPEMRSSSYHGVTTALIGNCGVTFAPVAPDNRRYMAELMESVEDIAADAILEGLPWSWTSYGEYLDAVQGFEPALNVVGLAGHSAIRYEAMGDRSLDEGAQATDTELGRIADLVRESIEGGAVGFSTSRFLGHKVPDGRCTPGTHADQRETKAIQEAAVAAGGVGTLFQAAPDFFTRFQTELEIFERGAELGCQVLFSGGAGSQGDGGVSLFEEFLTRNNDAGRRIATCAHTRPSGSLFGLAQVCPFDTPAWTELMALPSIAERAARLADPAHRPTLTAEAKEAGFRWNVADRLHPMGFDDVPDYDLDRRGTVLQRAHADGIDPVDWVIGRLIESEGRELYNLWLFGGTLENQWPYLQMEHCVPLLGDAGAHVGQLIDADSTTFLLSELTRERSLFTLPEAIRTLTSRPAGVLGLTERGQVREGWHADLNVIDYDGLSTLQPEYVNDFPLGGGRFVVKSRGYDATIVGGEVVIAGTDHTGHRPGRVIREFDRG